MPVLNLDVNRRLTKSFIDANPVTLVLTPNTKIQKPAGGWVLQAGSARGPQVMTIIEQTGLSGQPEPVVTVDGVERKVAFELLGEYDATMAIHDSFTYQGKDWEVVGIYFDNGYEIRAMVTARG